jgi:hypothetical protein
VSRDIRRADPVLHRRAVLIVAAGTLIGALLIFLFERYQGQMQAWLLADPSALETRMRAVLVMVALVLFAPLAAFGVWCWRFGGRVREAAMFPPPGVRVVRDTPVVEGAAALARALGLRALAVSLWAASVLFCVLLWRMARWLVEIPA